MVAGGATVLLTTQYMEEAEALADNIVVMDGGRVIAEGPPAQLRAAVGGQVLQVRPARADDLPEVAALLVRAGLAQGSIDAEDGVVALPIDGEAQLTLAVRALGESQLPVAGIDTHLPSLDEVFLTLTQRRKS